MVLRVNVCQYAIYMDWVGDLPTEAFFQATGVVQRSPLGTPQSYNSGQPHLALPILIILEP